MPAMSKTRIVLPIEGMTCASCAATVSALRNSPRSGRMMSPADSWAVATWYSSGWNWW